MQLYVTSFGRMKLMKLGEGKAPSPTSQQNESKLHLIRLDPNEHLVGAGFVSKKDKVVVYREKEDPVEMSVKDIPIIKKTDEAVKIVETSKGNAVTGFKVIRS
jgi:6-phosphogluconolactonase (cycloisomerase 2 family)